MSYQYHIQQCASTNDSDDFNQNIQDNINKLGNLGSDTISLAQWVVTTFLPLILAVGLVYILVRKVTIASILITGLLAAMLYIFFNNMTGSNRAGALPKATYPLPPHLGNEGVSGENRSCSTCY